MPEYIFTNLPQYVKITPRSDFSSSVVSSGAVLLFSEDGYTLTGKLPDGTFITIGGSGTDVSDTTAEAGDVLSGRIFYTSGGTQTTGTIPTVTASLAANVTTVPSGYIASAQTLTVPLASSATVAGGIVTIPQGYVPAEYTVSAGGGGSSTDFFRCATVTSGGSTWTGYKAVLSGGSYSYESAASSGLTFGAGFTPQVGKIYDNGALVQVDKLFEGEDTSLVFYAPLNTSSATAATSQTMTEDGTVTYQNYQGIQCAYFDGSAKITVSDTSALPTGSAASTIAGWFNFAYTDNFNHLLTLENEFGIRAYGSLQVFYTQGDVSMSDPVSNTWYHIAGVWDGSTVKMYVNGQYISESSSGLNISSGSLAIGSLPRFANGEGYVAGVRVYNRALSDVEIAELAAEFTPSVS